MNSYNKIAEFNKYLSNTKTNLKLNEYFKLFYSEFYNKLDISFIDYFLELYNHDNEFIVDHYKLKEYNLLYNFNQLNEYFIHLNLMENIDYQIKIINGCKQFKLTPYAFKICLMNSNNSQKYIHYYLLLEQIYKYYHEYLMIQKNNNIIGELFPYNYII